MNLWRLPWWFSSKESTCDAGDSGSILGSGRSSGEGNGNPLQYSCLENPMDRGARWTTVHGIAKGWTWQRVIGIRIFGLQNLIVQFSRSVVSDSLTPWTAACQASLSITNSWSLLKLMSIESVMPSNHLILCCPLLLLHSVFPSIRVFSNESILHIRWPKYWSFSFNISPSNETQDWSPLGWTGWISLESKGLSKSLLQHHSSKASILMHRKNQVSLEKSFWAFIFLMMIYLIGKGFSWWFRQ